MQTKEGNMHQYMCPLKKKNERSKTLKRSIEVFQPVCSAYQGEMSSKALTCVYR